MNAQPILIAFLINCFLSGTEMNPLVLFSEGKPKLSSDKVIVFSERKSSFRAYNSKEKCLCKIVIDGALIKTGQRCDYGLWVEDNQMYLIELKGCDTEKACSQISATYDFFVARFTSEHFDYKFRVVSTRVMTAPNLQVKRKLLERRTGIKVNIKAVEMTERV